MTPEHFAALVSFAFVTGATPGPNNLMLMASGANFGIRRTLPHMLGITVGFPLMLILVGLGIMRIFDAWPVSYTILKVLSLAYMLWLAWKIATAAPPGDGPATGKPFTLVQAAAFQWVNPKAWSMALGAITLFAAQRSTGAVLIVALVFACASVATTTLWATLGAQLRRLLMSPGLLRWFNISMALLLLASLAPALLAGDG